MQYPLSPNAFPSFSNPGTPAQAIRWLPGASAATSSGSVIKARLPALWPRPFLLIPRLVLGVIKDEAATDPGDSGPRACCGCLLGYEDATSWPRRLPSAKEDAACLPGPTSAASTRLCLAWEKGDQRPTCLNGVCTGWLLL